MDIVVDDAVLFQQPTGTLVWQVTYTADGQSYSHAFPQSVFAWRVAEYDLDPDDVDHLLELVLYEAHIVQDPDHPRFLRNAPTLADAREHYLTQISAAKAGGTVKTRNRRKGESRMIDPAKIKGRVIADNAEHPDTPLAMLKAHLTIDPEHVAAMRESVHRNRAIAAQQ